MIDLEKSKQKLDEINHGYHHRIRCGGRRKLSFEERYKRLTTYIEVDLFAEVQALREQGKIRNVTQFFNEAVKNYLEK